MGESVAENAGVSASLPAPGNLASVAIVGMAKNAGKTVVLNYLARRAAAAGVRLGLVSVGRDGEAVDVFTSRPKPRIWAPAGALVATVPAGVAESASDGAFPAAMLDPASVRATGVATALGEIVVGSVLRGGRVELVGPAEREQARRLVELLRAEGATLVLIDGALDRMASAAPAAGQAIVLATGAVLGRSAVDVARKTAFRVRLFSLPPAPAAAKAAMVHEALTEEDAEAAAEAGRGAEFLAASGAVTDRLLIALGRRGFRGTLVAPDATRFLVGPERVAFFEARGGRLAVAEPIRLLAVTVNSHNPTGPGLEPGELLRTVAAAVRPVPVFDVVYGWKGDAGADRGE